ncbi:hypothetical protein [Bradyrhizobium erythrophlei]|uniref:Uncharacterized protein n=1 Tax=Bradyrhizobium erythrophlei TaxID=1437360 RepID=A0A1H4XHI4_9BRAD|nr:hypothetical protein [Bradyrhizobium erythrophlei]SED04610.1 hypothetical protein SAMN05444164_3519 [Bradyrhizobium erythrophlei]
MERRIRLQLHNFPKTPNSLRRDPAIDNPVDEISVNLADLYFHYYRDQHGKNPPRPDPALFEHLQYLTPTSEFRILGDGLGVSTLSRRTLSSQLGQAFCRQFLHDHLNITYFAHIDQVIDRALRPGFGDMLIRRGDDGDLPDYFCAEAVNKVILAEAKGRHASISFGSKAFKNWRDQFGRLIVERPKGTPLSVKGYIIATRFATESMPYTKSALYAEDPRTPGEISLDEDRSLPLGRAVIALHYSELAQKLNQPILAEALGIGFPIPNEILIQTVIWELAIGPLAGKRFVGGYYSSDGSLRVYNDANGRLRLVEPDPSRLDVRHATFLGVEEQIFEQVVAFARGAERPAIDQFDQAQFFYSAISMLRDGSVIGPIEFFAPITARAF